MQFGLFLGFSLLFSLYKPLTTKEWMPISFLGFNILYQICLKSDEKFQIERRRKNEIKQQKQLLQTRIRENQQYECNYFISIFTIIFARQRKELIANFLKKEFNLENMNQEVFSEKITSVLTEKNELLEKLIDFLENSKLGSFLGKNDIQLIKESFELGRCFLNFNREVFCRMKKLSSKKDTEKYLDLFLKRNEFLKSFLAFENEILLEIRKFSEISSNNLLNFQKFLGAIEEWWSFAQNQFQQIYFNFGMLLDEKKLLNKLKNDWMQGNGKISSYEKIKNTHFLYPARKDFIGIYLEIFEKYEFIYEYLYNKPIISETQENENQIKKQASQEANEKRRLFIFNNVLEPELPSAIRALWLINQKSTITWYTAIVDINNLIKQISFASQVRLCINLILEIKENRFCDQSTKHEIKELMYSFRENTLTNFENNLKNILYSLKNKN